MAIVRYSFESHQRTAGPALNNSSVGSGTIPLFDVVLVDTDYWLAFVSTNTALAGPLSPGFYTVATVVV